MGLPFQPPARERCALPAPRARPVHRACVTLAASLVGGLAAAQLLLGSGGCHLVLGIDEFVGPGGATPQGGGGAGAQTTSTGGQTAGGGQAGQGAGAGGGAGGDECGRTDWPPSCADPTAPGTGCDCGASQTDDCCASDTVEGGDEFVRGEPNCSEELVPSDQRLATVPTYRLDRYEVTVGRFRQFYPAAYAPYIPDHPEPGWGEHSGLTGSGWQTDWPVPSVSDVDTALTVCGGEPSTPPAGVTWTPTARDSETLPINCVPWIVAFMFCAWDGGYLPTDAEWDYAAIGGTDYRRYPWGNVDPEDTPDDSHLVWKAEGPAAVGSKPEGRARWGQLDLAGNVAEWMLDEWTDNPAGDETVDACSMPSDCASNCFKALWPVQYRWAVVRGGSWSSYGTWQVINGKRNAAECTTPSPERGFRCARAAQ